MRIFLILMRASSSPIDLPRIAINEPISSHLTKCWPATCAKCRDQWAEQIHISGWCIYAKCADIATAAHNPSQYEAVAAVTLSPIMHECTAGDRWQTTVPLHVCVCVCGVRGVRAPISIERRQNKLKMHSINSPERENISFCYAIVPIWSLLTKCS